MLSFGGGTMIAEMEKRVPDLRGKAIVEAPDTGCRRRSLGQ